MATEFTLSNGVKLPSVGFGTFKDDGFSVKYALEAGYKLFDTAGFYKNEAVVSGQIADYLEAKGLSRDSVFYETKVMGTGNEDYEGCKALVQEQIDKAGKLKYIDLLLIHAPSGDKTYRLTLWKVFQEFAEAGYIKNLGVSNYGQHHLEELLSWDGLKIKPVVNQLEINPWLQRLDLREYCDKVGVLVQGYSTQMRGKSLDNVQLVKLAAKYNKSVNQILVRWNLQIGVPCLPKSAQADRIKSAIDVFGFEISAEDMEAFGDKQTYYVTWGWWDPTKWFK